MAAEGRPPKFGDFRISNSGRNRYDQINSKYPSHQLTNNAAQLSQEAQIKKEYEMLLLTRLASVCCLMACAAMALADDTFIYPKNDQNMEQQQKDKSECYNWAKGETGFDPQEAPRAETRPPSQSSGADGSIIRGAARGALLGEIIDNDAGKGAAAGAAIGGMRRRDRRRQEEQDYARWEQEEAARYAEKRNRYDRAYKVCLEARDYSVS